MKTLVERVEYLRKTLEKSPSTETKTISGWKEGKLVRKIVRVDSNYLMYRIENSRTKRQQLRYLSNHPVLDKDFFSDPESTEVQNAQEAILLEMIHATGKDFIQDLDDRGQDDPAIITYEGYIVNGNRRTAALKSLGTEYVNCVILPEDATKKDIYALEQELQIAQDFKEDYHWINELINFGEGINDKNLDFGRDQMAKRLRIRRTDLDAKLRMLDLVEQFLFWKSIPYHYDYEKLDYAEEIFRQLEKATKKIESEANRQELMNAAFNLIENPPDVGRLYSHITSLIRNWETVYERISSEKKLEDTNTEIESPSVTNQQEDIQILEDILEGEDEQSIPITEIFNDSENSEETAKLLMETIADVEAETKEQKEAEAVYKGISTSLRALQCLIVDEGSTKLEASKNKLEEIIKVSIALLDQIKNFHPDE